MQLKTTIILFSLSVSYVTIGQVGIGTNTPHASAALEVLTTNKGFLAPRVALTSNSDVATIASPATGLMIYNTATAGTSPNAVVPGYYYYSGSKWERLITTTPDATIEFNTANPNTGSPTFTPNTPASADYIYVSSVDASQWFWNGSTYVTYVAPASTAWNLANTTNDAGNSKTANIWRSGSIGIGTNNPVSTLQINNPLAATASVNANAQVLRLSRPTTSGLKWDNIAQFNLGSYSTAIAAASRLDLALTNGGDNTNLTNVMTWQANGNVGINNTTPSAPLVVQGVSGIGSLKLIAPVINSNGDNWWLGFGHGTTSTDANDRARIGAEVVSGGAGRLFFTTGGAGASQTRAMFIDELQRVGIGTSTPGYKLSVIGNTRIQPNTTNTGSGGGNLWVEIYGKEPPATDTQAGGIKLGWYNNFGGIEVVRPGSVTGVGLAFNYATTGGTTTEGFRLTNAGRVGVGTTAPGSTLEVNGSATNTTAFNAGASSSIDFSNSNLAFTSASPGAFTLSNIKDGGTYTLSVQGATSGTASFTAAGFTFKSMNNAQTIAGKHTLYTFMVMGTTVYFYMSTGF